MEDYLNAFDGVYLTIGTGEISGWVHVNELGIEIYNGWNSLPELKFNYCPFCGKKLA